jgi:hypothetical protein
VPPQLGLLKKINVVNLAQNPQLNCLMPAQRNTSAAAATAADGGLTANLDGSTGSGAIKLADGMYAVPLRHTSEQPYCTDEQLLPCFLYFANYTVPRTDNSKMACPAILRRHIEEARSMCAGDGAGQLGSQSHNVADALAADEQSWKIEPGYYQYRGCRCFSVSASLRLLFYYHNVTVQPSPVRYSRCMCTACRTLWLHRGYVCFSESAGLQLLPLFDRQADDSCCCMRSMQNCRADSADIKNITRCAAQL